MPTTKAGAARPPSMGEEPARRAPRRRQAARFQTKHDIMTGELFPQERDLHALLRLWLRKVAAGRPLRYATFREAWEELHFSLIYEGCHDRADFTAYVHSLLAAACDHLLWPLPPEQPSQAGPEGGCGADGRSPSAKAGEQRGGRRCSGMLPSAARGRGRGRSGGRQPVGATAAGPSQQQSEAGCEEDGSPPAPQAAEAPGSSGQAGQLQPEPEAAPQPASAAARSRVMDRAALMALLLEDDEGDHAPLSPPGAPAGAEAVGASMDHGAAHLHRLVSQLPDLDVPGLPAGPAGPGSAGMPPLPSPRAHGDCAAASDSAAPFELQVGALYALYTLHETQPGRGGRVRPYVSLSALRALGGLIRRARAAGLPDVPAAARRLLDGRALVVGAMRRPPASTQLPPVAPPRHAQADVRQRHAVHPAALAHMRDTQADLRELRHLQLLASSYAAAQRRLFAAADPAGLPQSIADLKMGDRLEGMAEQMRADIVDILGGLQPPKGRKRDRDRQAEGKADGRKKVRRSAFEQQRADNIASIMGDAGALGGGDSSGGDEGGGGDDLSGLPPAARAVFARKAAERAAMRRAERQWAARGVAALAAAGSMPGDEGDEGDQDGSGGGGGGGGGSSDGDAPMEERRAGGGDAALAAAGSTPGEEDDEEAEDGGDGGGVGGDDSGDAPPPEAPPPPAAGGVAAGRGRAPGTRRAPAARARVSGAVTGAEMEVSEPGAAWSDGGDARGGEAVAAGEAVKGADAVGRGAGAASGTAEAKAGRGTVAGGKGGRARETVGGAGKGRHRAGKLAVAARGPAEQGLTTQGAGGEPSSAAAPLRAPRQQRQTKQAGTAGGPGERPFRGEPAAARAAPGDEEGDHAAEQRQQGRRRRGAAPAPVSQRGAAATSAAAPAASGRPAAQDAAAGRRGAKPAVQGGVGGERRREPDEAAGEGLEYDVLGLPVVPDLSRRGARKGNALEDILQGNASACASRDVDDAWPVSSMEVSDLSEEDAAAPVDGRATEEEEDMTNLLKPGGRRTAGAAAKSLPKAPAVGERPLESAQPAAGRRTGAAAASKRERRPSELPPPVGAGATSGDGGSQPAGGQRKALDWEQFEQDMLRLGEQADALLAEGDFC